MLRAIQSLYQVFGWLILSIAVSAFFIGPLALFAVDGSYRFQVLHEAYGLCGYVTGMALLFGLPPALPFAGYLHHRRNYRFSLWALVAFLLSAAISLLLVSAGLARGAQATIFILWTLIIASVAVPAALLCCKLLRQRFA